MYQTVSFTCPHCEQPFDIQQWSIIYADDDPKITKQAHNGTLFRNTCPHCGKSMMIAYNCVYSDKQKHFLVSLQANRDQAPITPIIPNYKLRIEYTLSAFIERIRILDAGLDDLAFEAFRTLLLTQVRTKHPDKNITFLRFDSLVNDNIYFQLSTDPSDQIKVPLAAFWRIEDKIKAGGFRPNVYGYLNVHGKWVEQSGILDSFISNKPEE